METPSSKNTPATEHDVPHAGSEFVPEDVREKPVTHFDNTPLQTAVAQGFIGSTPESPANFYDKPLGNRTEEDDRIDSPATVVPDGYEPKTELKVEQVQPQPKVKRIHKILAWAAGLALVGGGTAAVVHFTQAPNDEPVAEAPANPGEDPVDNENTGNEGGEDTPEAPVAPVAGENDPVITPENEQAILESLRLTADMTPQQLGEKYSSTLERWGMAGAVPATFDAWVEAGAPDSEVFAAEIAKNNVHIYATALFGEDYAQINDEKIKRFIGVAETRNAALLSSYLLTTGNEEYPNTNTKNIEPLQADYDLISVTDESQPDAGISLVVRIESLYNDENTMFAGTIEGDGHISDTYITLTPSSETPDVLTVSALDINDLN